MLVVPVEQRVLEALAVADGDGTLLSDAEPVPDTETEPEDELDGLAEGCTVSDGDSVEDAEAVKFDEKDRLDVAVPDTLTEMRPLREDVLEGRPERDVDAVVEGVKLVERERTPEAEVVTVRDEEDVVEEHADTEGLDVEERDAREEPLSVSEDVEEAEVKEEGVTLTVLLSVNDAETVNVLLTLRFPLIVPLPVRETEGVDDVQGEQEGEDVKEGEAVADIVPVPDADKVGVVQEVAVTVPERLCVVHAVEVRLIVEHALFVKLDEKDDAPVIDAVKLLRAETERTFVTVAALEREAENVAEEEPDVVRDGNVEGDADAEGEFELGMGCVTTHVCKPMARKVE